MVCWDEYELIMQRCRNVDEERIVFDTWERHREHPECYAICLIALKRHRTRRRDAKRRAKRKGYWTLERVPLPDLSTLDRIELLEEYFDGLSEPQKHIIRMKLSGYTQTQIAMVLDMPLRTVRRRWEEGLMQFWKNFQKT